LFSICLLLVFIGMSSAQEFRATISGEVTDRSGLP